MKSEEISHHKTYWLTLEIKTTRYSSKEVKVPCTISLKFQDETTKVRYLCPVSGNLTFKTVKNDKLEPINLF